MNSTTVGEPMDVPPGPILLGGLLQSFLLGTIVNQAFKYWMDSGDDSRRKRTFVICVILFSLYVFSLLPFAYRPTILVSLQTILEDYKVWRTLILKQHWVRLDVPLDFALVL